MDAVTDSPASRAPSAPSTRPAPSASRGSAASGGTPPRLIATDLDGTLLHDDKSVSDRTVAALAAAEVAGIDVFFVTGRPARWMGVVSDHVHGHGLAICANGAAVVDLHRGRQVVRVRPLAREDALTVVSALRAAAPGVTFAVERSGGIHYEPGYPPLHLDPVAVVAPAEKLLAPGFGGGEVAEGTAVAEGAEQPVLKLLAFHRELEPDAFLALAREAAGGHAEFTRSSRSALLEISGSGVSKASTLERCCTERGIGPEEVVAFGDMPNDLEMLSWAGTSYAMANAHPDVLAATTHRTAANEDDGVAAVIEELLRGR